MTKSYRLCTLLPTKSTNWCFGFEVGDSRGHRSMTGDWGVYYESYLCCEHTDRSSRMPGALRRVWVSNTSDLMGKFLQRIRALRAEEETSFHTFLGSGVHNKSLQSGSQIPRQEAEEGVEDKLWQFFGVVALPSEGKWNFVTCVGAHGWDLGLRTKQNSPQAGQGGAVVKAFLRTSWL